MASASTASGTALWPLCVRTPLKMIVAGATTPVTAQKVAQPGCRSAANRRLKTKHAATSESTPMKKAAA